MHVLLIAQCLLILLPFINRVDMTDQILTENIDGVLVVTFNRPEKKNAISNAMWAGICDIFRSASEDSSAVQGASVGGGATVLFHADIVYAADTFRMRLPFASLGLAPEWGSSYMLQANIGAQRAAELFYTAEWVDAEKALSQGIVAQVLPAEELFDHAMAKAREIAQWPVNALREIKRSLRMHHLPAIEIAMQAEQEAMARQAGSPENMEAITAFMEKRTPNFRDL
jgi:enoyl-CoA hydratase/carnithine racemase